MKLSLRSHSVPRRAFTLTELAIVILILMMVAAICIPQMVRDREKAIRIKCVGNLKQIGLSFKVFANDHSDKFPFGVTNSLGYTNITTAWHHFQAMSNECGSAKILSCPGDRERLYNMRSDFSGGPTGLPFAGNAAVSYGSGLEADETQPNVVLAMERNLVTNAMNLQGKLFLINARIPPPEWDGKHHWFNGNLVLADGSGQQMTKSNLGVQVAQGLASTGLATNRWLLPLLP